MSAHLKAEEDGLPDAGQSVIKGVALADAAGDGRTDDGVAAIGFRAEDDSEPHGVIL